MLIIIKKEIKFISLIAFILILIFAVQTFAISPAKNKGIANASNTRRNNREIRKTATDLFVDVYSPSKLQMALPADLTRKFKKEIADAQDDEDVLQKIIAFRIEPEFRLPQHIIQKAESEKRARVFESYADDAIRELLREQYANFEDYKFVKSPSLSSSTIEMQLAFSEYVDYEAPAFIGLDVSEGKTVDALTEAKAKSELRLALLNIIKVILETGKASGIKAIQDLKFVPRPENIARRFKVKKQEPCYYRPFVAEMTITANETNLFDFIRRCIDPSPDGNSGQFLAVHSFNLENPDCLASSMICPNCRSQTPRNAMFCVRCHQRITTAFDLNAKIQLVAFIIDPRFPLVKFEKPKQQQGPIRFSPRFYNRPVQ